MFKLLEKRFAQLGITGRNVEKLADGFDNKYLYTHAVRVLSLNDEDMDVQSASEEEEVEEEEEEEMDVESESESHSDDDAFTLCIRRAIYFLNKYDYVSASKKFLEARDVATQSTKTNEQLVKEETRELLLDAASHFRENNMFDGTVDDENLLELLSKLCIDTQAKNVIIINAKQERIIRHILSFKDGRTKVPSIKREDDIVLDTMMEDFYNFVGKAYRNTDAYEIIIQAMLKNVQRVLYLICNCEPQVD